MAEKIFDAQTNYGWGLTFNLTGKAPAINKRIFNTLEDAQAYADDFNDSAVEGLLLSVVADTDKKNGAYFVKTIKTSAEGEPAVLVKVGDVDLSEIQKLISDETKKLQEVDEQLEKTSASILATIGDIDSATTVSQMIADVQKSTEDNKKIVDDYTVNGKKISNSPVLSTTDFVVGEEYTLLDHENYNVTPGDILTTAISKLEVMLANTTLAITASLNDLDKRLGNPSETDENGEVIKEATGLYKNYEELLKIVNQNNNN